MGREGQVRASKQRPVHKSSLPHACHHGFSPAASCLLSSPHSSAPGLSRLLLITVGTARMPDAQHSEQSKRNLDVHISTMPPTHLRQVAVVPRAPHSRVVWVHGAQAAL